MKSESELKEDYFSKLYGDLLYGQQYAINDDLWKRTAIKVM